MSTLKRKLKENVVSEIASGSICIENVSKTFRKATGSSNTYSTLKSALVQIVSPLRSKKNKTINNQSTSIEPPAVSEKWYKALDSISLNLAPGSSTALIGRNGSGKSTILKLIAGIYTPDEGSVQVKGKVSALIELGAGFHPDFTGRENIFLGGVMFGLSRKEIEKRFDDIVKYAELAHVIDEPVRTYSSGMYMRLGFSLAIHTDPDILLVDEVLAVGDAHFIHRCQDSISEFKRKGKTLVFVTHDLSSVSKWCDEAIWLDKGKIKLRGTPRMITDAYLASVHTQEDQDIRELEAKNSISEPNGTNSSESDQIISSEDALGDPNRKRWGNKLVEITSIELMDQDGTSTRIFSEDSQLQIHFNYTIKSKTLTSSKEPDLLFGIGILRADGLEIFGTNTGMDEVGKKIFLDKFSNSNGNIQDDLEIQDIRGVAKFKIKRLGLTEGTYFIDVAAHAEDGTPYDYHHRMHKIQVRPLESKAVGIISPKAEWDFELLNNSQQEQILRSEGNN